MNGVDQASGLKERVPPSLLLILVMYSGTILSPYQLLPFLRPIAPQTLIAAAAIVTAVFYLAVNGTGFGLERIQWVYLAYCLAAIIGLHQSQEVGFLSDGIQIVANIWKHLVLLFIIALCARSVRTISLVWKWLLVTISLFHLHSFKALLAGYTGLAGRFDNYVGMVSNADYIGVFAAITSVMFLHNAQETRDLRLKGLCYSLSAIAIVIMVKTHTRAAFLVLLVTVVYWAIRGGSFTKSLRRLRIILFAGGLLLVVGRISSSDEGKYFERMASIMRFQSEDADFDTRSRLFMWRQGVRIGLDHPVLGVGSGATTPYLDLRYEDVDLRDKGRESEGFSIHNTYIQIFAERGLFGLLLFALMLLFAYRNVQYIALLNTSLSNMSRLKVIAEDVGIYLVGYMTGALFITIDYDWTLFVVVGLAVSLRRLAEVQSQEANRV